MHTRYLEDFAVGDKFKTRAITLSEGLILEFALMYDPQHMHTDKVQAEAGPFGGLIASGFQTLALSFRQFYDLGLMVQSNIIGPGLDEVRWSAPVHAGDTIHSEWEVLETRPSESKPDRGVVWLALHDLQPAPRQGDELRVGHDLAAAAGVTGCHL